MRPSGPVPLDEDHLAVPSLLDKHESLRHLHARSKMKGASRGFPTHGILCGRLCNCTFHEKPHSMG